MILTVSETLARIGDWISLHFAELAGTISIPVILWFLFKLILSFVKNKQAIKSAVLDSIKAVNSGIEVLKKEISDFKDAVLTDMTKFESDMENKIDNKFEDLKEKRKQMYNDIMAGVDKIETKAVEIIENAKEEIQTIVENVEIEQPVKIETKQTEISEDDILR